MSENENPRLKKHFSIIAHSPDVVELRYGVWNPISFTLTDESESGQLFRILSQLDGRLSPAEVARKEGIAVEEVQSLLDHLIELGAVEMRAANALDYYIDHIVPTLANLDGRHFRDKPVLLLGDREITGQIAQTLQQSLPDQPINILEESDPAWQLLKKNDTSWLLNGIAFEQNLTHFDAWQDAFLIAALKIINPSMLHIINQVCLAKRIPWLHAAIDGPFLFVGPLVEPYRTACYLCFETRVAMNLREASSYQAYKEALVKGQIQNGQVPQEPVLLGMLASHTAFEALNFLLTQTSFTAGKVLGIYLPTMEITYNEVLRVVGCPACGSVPGRDDQELYFDARAFLSNRI